MSNIDLPADPAATDEVAAALVESVGTADARTFSLLAWSWAQQACGEDSERAGHAYWAVLDSAGVDPSAEANPEAEVEAEGVENPEVEVEGSPKHEPHEEAEPSPEGNPHVEVEGSETTERQAEPQKPANPEAALEPSAQRHANPRAEVEGSGPRRPKGSENPRPKVEGSAVEGTPLEELEALAARVVEAPAEQVPTLSRWDPEAQPVLAGQVRVVEALDLRGREGPTRVLTLATADGLREVWLTWAALRSQLRRQESEHGRALAPGDLLALRYAGTEAVSVGGSTRKARQFAVVLGWAR